MFNFRARVHATLIDCLTPGMRSALARSTEKGRLTLLAVEAYLQDLPDRPKETLHGKRKKRRSR